MSLANTITLRTRIIQQFEHVIQTNNSESDLVSYSKKDAIPSYLDAVVFYLYFGFIIVNLILSVLSEKYPSTSNDLSLKSESLQSRANLISYLTFWWTNSLIQNGFKRDLTSKDLYEIDHKDKSETITNRIDKEWSTKASTYLKKINFYEENNFNHKEKTVKPNYEPSDEHEEKIELNDVNKEKKNPKIEKLTKISEPSLTIFLIKLFGVQFLGIICLKIGHDILSFSLPVILDKLINFIKDKEQKNSIGFFYILLLCLTSFSQTVMMQHYMLGVFLIGQQIKIGLQNLIYRKSLKLSASARKETTVGEMVTMKI
jgi:ATP-binding cassette subfamily C (CFTR/MRP) protein 1